MAVMNLPTLPPLKHVKNGKYCYLVTYKNVWDKGSCKAKKGNTKTVAKIEGGDVVGKVIWLDDFLEQHPELEEVDTYRRRKDAVDDNDRNFYYLYFEPKDEIVSLRKAMEAKTYIAGPTWVLDHIIEGTPLIKALNKIFSGYNRNRKIISIAYYMYLRHTTAMECYSSFAENYRLPWQVPLRPWQCSKLFKSITQDDIDKFLKVLNAEVCKIEEQNIGNINTYYALDSTSISTYAKNLTKAQYGHNKDGDSLKQINLLMLVNQETGVPVYYRSFDGDVPDVSTIIHTLRETIRLGVNRRAVAVCDRGYSSVTNIHRFYQSEVSFIMNFRTSYSLAKNFIIEHKSELESIDSYIPSIEQHAISLTTQWSFPVNFKTDCACRRPHLKADIHVHIYFDENIKHFKKQNITKILSIVRSKLINNESLNSSEKYLADRLLIIEKDEDDKVVSVKTNQTKIAEYLFTAGFRILVSDCVKDAKEAHRAYQMRNSVEEAFAVFKQDLGGRRFGTSTNQTTEGKLFNIFVAASIGLMFRTQIAYCKTKGMEIPFDGDRVIMSKLEGIKAKVWNDGLYYTEVIGKKKELLEALNIPLPDAVVFTKEEQKEFAEDELIENDECFVASTVDDLASMYSEI